VGKWPRTCWFLDKSRSVDHFPLRLRLRFYVRRAPRSRYVDSATTIMLRPKRSVRALGFTLIELLIVIAVIGVLMALLLPAVLAARETSHRIACANNLKQIGLALQGFHEARKCFPIGTALKGYPDGTCPDAIPIGLLNTGPYRPGVFAMILPFLEQEALYRSLEMNSAIDEGVNVALGKTIIVVYICPSSKHTYGLQKAPHSEPLADRNMQFAVTDYNGLNGSNRLFAAAPSASGLQNHGGFAERQQLSMIDFVDGTSHTIDVVETVNFGRGVWIHGRPHYNQAAYTINTLNGYNNVPNTVYPDGLSPLAANRGPGKGVGGTWGISSNHPGGANALFVDGSVHFLNNSLSAVILTALATRDGAEMVDETAF
jgi:prepilin-type N-terminal cleavage/methylation domain-containing protein/prepilin-type processing-associated H-X9-DG protein